MDEANFLNELADEMTTAGRPATAGKLRAAAAILSASRPADGYLRASEGPDMRLLGTLPVTADGCVAMPGQGGEVYHPKFDGPLYPVLAFDYNDDGDELGRSLTECGHPEAADELPVYIAYWSEYEADTGAHSEFVAPLSACYSKPSAAESAKGGH